MSHIFRSPVKTSLLGRTRALPGNRPWRAWGITVLLNLLVLLLALLGPTAWAAEKTVDIPVTNVNRLLYVAPNQKFTDYFSTLNNYGNVQRTLVYTAGSTFDTELKSKVGTDYTITSVKLIVGSSTKDGSGYGPYNGGAREDGDKSHNATGAYTVLSSYDPSNVTWSSFGNGGVAGTDYASTALTSGENDGDTTIWTFATTLLAGSGGWINDTASNKGLFFFTTPQNTEIYLLTTPSANVIWRVGATAPPGAPTIGTATAGAGQISVAFTPPASVGSSAITSYSVTCASSDGGTASDASGTSSPIVVTGLTNGKTYTCTVTATNSEGTGPASEASNAVKPANNLIANGDFQSGDTGFQSQYSNSCTRSIDAGCYAVTASPFDVHVAWDQGYDHTYGNASGRMLVANGAPESTYVWRQTVTVTPNTNYLLTAYARSVYPEAPAELKIQVDLSAGCGAANSFSDAGSIYATTNLTEWIVNYAALSIRANDSTQICIRILNNNLAEGGNDFAIDDISLVPDNRMPRAVNDLAAVTAENSVVIDVLANDVAGTETIDPASIDLDPGTSGRQTSYTVPGKGTFEVVDATGYKVRFTAATGFSGGASGRYRVSSSTNAIPSNVATICVTPTGSGCPQTITFTSTAPDPATVGGAAYRVTATGGESGNAVTFTSATPLVCTVSDSTVDFGGTGTCTINANQAGNESYAAAAQVQQSFPVATTPGAPTNLMATPGNGQATIAFTAPTTDGGLAITNYQYSTNDGSTWTAFGPAETTSPVTITDLTNDVTYQVKLRAVNWAGVGTASAVVAVTPSAPSTSHCGPGLPLPTSPPALWQQLALPCVPSASSSTVRAILGTTTNGQLDASIYGNAAANGWLMYGNDLANDRNLKLTVDDTLTTGGGYWIKSFSAPVGGGNLTLSGNATPVTVSGGEGCASANGCAAVPVTTVAGADRYNLVGTPFPYNVNWAQVRVRVKDAGGSLVGVYTPSQAAGLAASGNANPPVMSNQIWIYNGTQYQTWTDVSLPNPGNLKYFQSFWVKVLAAVAANGYTVELLIPAEASTHSQVLPAEGALFATRDRPWYLAWLDWLIPAAAADEMGFAPGPHPGPHAAPGARRGPAPIPPAAAITDPTLDLLITQGIETLGLDPTAAERAAHATARAEGREWYVSLRVDEPATGYQDHNSVLGQLLNAQAGYDPQDLLELPPFGTPYLTLVFPHPEWGARAGDYASDFRPAQRLDRRGRPLPGRPAADWAFEIRSDRPGTQVILRWEGDPTLLQRTRLIDRTSGRTINPTAKAYANGYPVTLTKGTRAFTWRFLGTP